MEPMTFHRYVALGDSFTEGVGDPDAARPNGLCGWADRAAAVLAQQTPDFRYANLAIRGRKLQPIIDEQLEPALAQQPDLVSMYAGANDIIRPSVDIDLIVKRYDEAIGRLADSGATVVLFTAFDPGHSAVFGRTRGRFAIYNELVREIADRRSATIVDFWRMREYRDWRLWDVDRMHMSSAGHQQMAIAVLDTLGISHDLKPLPLPSAPRLSRSEQWRADARWTREHALPWVHRRITRQSSGDAVAPRWPQLSPVNVD